jgi:hypothetical protein
MIRSRLRAGVPLQRAVCACGWQGKSQSPEFYRCSVCYYQANAESAARRAAKLEQRASRYRDDAELYLRRAIEHAKKRGQEL